jgi:predicted small metal-binding protein
MKVDLTDYEIGDFTSYYAWCTVPGCAFITPDYDNERKVVEDIEEHYADEHDAEDSQED